MSKKASRKPDYSYHNDDYFVDDGILEGDAEDTEYTDWCAQCNHQRLGYMDPSTHVFYCNPCWHAFTQPQSNPPAPQQQPAQPPPPAQQPVQTSPPKKKPSRRSKKNKNKNQTQSVDSATNNNNKRKQPNKKNKTDTIDLTQRPSLFDTTPKQNKPSQSATKTQPKNTENSSKSSSIFANRPSLFGDTTPADDSATTTSTLLNRPSLFGDTDTTNQAQETKYNEEDEDVEEQKEIDIPTIQYIKEPKKQLKAKPKKRKPKSDGIIQRQFIGSRIESRQTFTRHKTQKKELIKSRFGVDGMDQDQKKKKNKRSEAKPHINLVVIGHVDAGKSTLMGRLLYEYGVVNNKTMHKFKTQSALQGKSSFAYAWVLDCHEEERARGITVDVSTHYFETPHRCITLLDSPGHKDFIPHMISGASQADAAILVINSKAGDFETGFDINNGQTREHALIAKSLGVQQMIVAVNKMDCSEWNKKRFDLIMVQIKAFLKEIGFVNKGKKKKNVIFVPVSGLTGGNLIRDKESKDTADAWWKCKVKDPYLTHLSLFELIDALRPSSTIWSDSLNGMLRMSITDIYKEANVGIVATGKILSGSVMRNEQILIQPVNLVTKIKNLISIDNHSRKYKHQIAIKGDNIQLLLDIKDSNDEIFDQIKIGDIISSPHEPLKLINRFQSKIVAMKNLKIPICKGHHVMIHTHSIEKEAFVFKINHLVNKKTGQRVESKKQVRHIKADQCAIITIKLRNKNDVILLDTYQNLKELGRITIRRDGQTVALGLVETVGL